MSGSFVRVGVIAGALMSMSGNASAEDIRWFTSQYDQTTTLIYGMPDTDYAPVVFNCDRGDPTVRLFITHDAPDAEDGEQMGVTLSSLAGSVELSAIGSFQEIDDLFHLESETRLDRKLVRVLSSGGILSLSVEGKIQEFPLAGAAEEIGALVAACGAPLNPDDLELRITNATSAPVVSVLFSQAGANDFDGDTYGNEVLAPGESTYLVIPSGRPGCMFDLMAEFDEDAERDPIQRSQDLCKSDEFLIKE